MAQGTASNAGGRLRLEPAAGFVLKGHRFSGAVRLAESIRLQPLRDAFLTSGTLPRNRFTPKAPARPRARLSIAMRIVASALSVIALIALLKSREKSKTKDPDPLLALRGSGRHLWATQHADDYVKSLREGWE